MRPKVSRKSMAIGILCLLVAGAVIPLGSSADAGLSRQDAGIQAIIENSVLDLSFIHNLTENLSSIVFTAYNESSGEIAKGREFGTKGERAAATILFDNMSALGLHPTRERISNTPRTLSEVPAIASKVEIQNKGLTVTRNNSSVPVSEFYVSARWNLTGAQTLFRHLPAVQGLFSRVLSSLGPRWFDYERLTHNFSYTNLRVIRKPYNYSLLTLPRSQEPFVYIAKDRSYGGWTLPNIKYTGLASLFKPLNNELFLWALFQPYCRGVIFFSANTTTFNCNPAVYDPLPRIYVNGILGQQIYDHPEEYRIGFSVNQTWQEAVESYNVIGQINGTDRDDTVLVTCLYDCEWNQGTADSAIGMAVVLGIAKYMKDQNITPRCTLRFIGFCGEEHGLRGAYYYEAVHRDEHIFMIIDLNQIGFTWAAPRLHLSLYTNCECLNRTISDIAERTKYVQRTNNVTGFRTMTRSDGGPPSNARVFAEGTGYKTILIVKDGPWYNHHKDGAAHQDGDVIRYFNWSDTSITGEMAWNITQAFAVNDDCSYRDLSGCVVRSLLDPRLLVTFTKRP